MNGDIKPLEKHEVLAKTETFLTDSDTYLSPFALPWSYSPVLVSTYASCSELRGAEIAILWKTNMQKYLIIIDSRMSFPQIISIVFWLISVWKEIRFGVFLGGVGGGGYPHCTQACCATLLPTCSARRATAAFNIWRWASGRWQGTGRPAAAKYGAGLRHTSLIT